MSFTSLIEINTLEQALATLAEGIAYHPLIVTPDTPVSEAIALMSHARATCTLENISPDNNYLLVDACASCVLVMEDTQLVGIFTKRDVVHLSAAGQQIGEMVIADVMTSSVVTIRQSELQDLFSVLNLFKRNRIHHLPVLDENNKLLGLLTHENLRQLMRPIDLLKLRLVSEVMNIRLVYAVPETSVLDITKLMTRNNVSSVVIIEKRDSLFIPIGIITERDIVQFQALNLDLDSIQVQKVMSSPVFSVSPDESLWSILMLMGDRRIHRVVVTGEQGEMLGFVTYTTILQALNPLDIYKLVQILEQKVSQLETEKLELLQNRNTELEAEVKKRTIKLQKQTEREQLLSAIANRIRVSLDLEEILNSLAMEVRKLLNCDRVLVYQLSANGSGRVIAEDVKSGWLSFQGKEVFDPCFAQDWIEPYLHGRIRVVNDINTNGMTPCHWELLNSLQIRAKILVPIIVGERLWGLMLTCQNDAPRIWQDEETELLQQLSTHVSIAIQQAELYQRLQLELQERKQTEFALSKSEQRLRTIVETSASGFVTVDMEGKILFVNPAAARMFNRNIQELQGWPFALPYDCHSHQVQEIEILQPEGQRRTVNMQPASIPWNGEDAFLMSLSDITELKETEELLRHSEGKYRLLVEHLPLGLVAHATDTSILTCNLKACELLGLTPDQMQDKTALDSDWYFCREDETVLPLPEYPVNLVIRTQQPLNNYVVGVNRPQSQTFVWLLVNAFPIFATNGTFEQVIVTFVDISERQAADRYRQIAEAKLQQLNEELEARVEQRTIALQQSIIEQKRVEEALRRSEERFRRYFEQSLVGMAITSPQNIWLEVNDYLCKILDYERHELLAMNWVEITHPDDLIEDMTYFNQVLAGEIEGYSIDKRFIRKDGQIVYASVSVRCVRRPDGSVDYFAKLVRDITDRKLAQEQLKASQAMLQLVLDTIPQRVFWKDRQSVILGCNRNFAEDVGFTTEEIIGKGSHELSATPEEIEEYIECDRLVINTGEPQLHIQETLHKPDGSCIWLETNKVPLKDLDGNIIGLLGTYEDITIRRTAEEALRYSEERFRIALNNSPIVVFNQDIDLRYTWIYNPALGFKYEDVIGKFDDDLFLPKDAQKLKSWKRHVLSTGQSMREEIVIGDDDNFTCYVLTIHPLRDRNQNIEGITCAALDITDRKKVEIALEESQYLIQRITEASPDILYIYDLHEKRNIYTNREIARLMGYSPQEIQDMGNELFIRIVHPDDLPRITEYHTGLMTASDEEIREIEYRMCDRFGNWYWFLSHDTVFNRDINNLPKQIIGAASEITERKQMEAQLRQTNAELARATRLKSEFLANMSHELRTPLNAILGMSEGLQESVFGTINHLQKRAIETIERSGKHLLELINDILDLSKIEAGKLELQLVPVSCISLCDSSVIFVNQQAVKKNIQISIEVPTNLPNLIVDERRFHQILINLLNNAVKFTHDGGKIQLLVEQVEEGDSEQVTGDSKEGNRKEIIEDASRLSSSGQWICFSIIDNGIGIAEADLDKLFQPFVQIDSSLNRQYNGTGLGLSLVRQLVKLHGGKITVTSKVNHGSCFRVYIPYPGELIIQNNVLAHRTQIFTNTQSQNLQVLIIEDSIVAAKQLARYLQEINIQTTIYDRGAGAIDEIIRIQPDLIVLDILLPTFSGWEVIKQIKAHPQTQNIPVIVISVIDERSQALSLGASDYIVKPFKREQVHKIFNKFQNPAAKSSTIPINTTVNPLAKKSFSIILLTEDNEANIATISNYLEARRYRVMLAKNRTEFIKIATTETPNLILIDIQLALMDGLATIQLIRGHQQLENVPIIVLKASTIADVNDGSSEQSYREKCLALGANEYFTKPFKLKIILDKIQTLLT